jgi:hypothetical protein
LWVRITPDCLPLLHAAGTVGYNWVQICSKQHGNNVIS